MNGDFIKSIASAVAEGKIPLELVKKHVEGNETVNGRPHRNLPIRVNDGAEATEEEVQQQDFDYDVEDGDEAHVVNLTNAETTGTVRPLSKFKEIILLKLICWF